MEEMLTLTPVSMDEGMKSRGKEEMRICPQGWWSLGRRTRTAKTLNLACERAKGRWMHTSYVVDAGADQGPGA